MEEQLELRVGMNPELARFLGYETGRIVPKQGKPSVTQLPVDQLMFEHFFLDRKLAKSQKEEESELANDLEFYNSASKEYRKSRFDNHVGKARVLADYYHKFSPNGSQPLINKYGVATREPGYIGVIFDSVFSGVEKRLGYSKK